VYFDWRIITLNNLQVYVNLRVYIAAVLQLYLRHGGGNCFRKKNDVSIIPRIRTV